MVNRNVPQFHVGFEWKQKEEEGRLTMTRDGDHIIAPFQCNWCTFQVFAKRCELDNSEFDVFLMCCLRCANIDAF
eukprot:1231055-Ditylum_brightwellii.AAC.1